MSDNPLVVVNNPIPNELVVQQKINSLSRLFTLKPAALELVSKATRAQGAVPGTFRNISTNEKWEEMRAVILFEPIEQREKYRKGEYSKDAKLCFSLDNVQPHPRAKNPPAMFCATCPDGDLNWEKWRDAKAKGVSGNELVSYLPKCRKYWHLFIADRQTQMPYYFNVKGTSVKYFETGMQEVARLFQQILQVIKSEIRAGKDVKMPNSVADVIWKISFTMKPKLVEGTWVTEFKDFKVMAPEDAAEFGKILSDINARRKAGQVQTQEVSEAEEAAAAVAEAPSKPVNSTAAEVAAKNSQIEI